MLFNQRVLIVEDETLIAMELADIVEGAGARVIGPVRSNRDAIRLIGREIPDLAVLDINLADGDASPIFEALTAAQVPVLICTAGILPPRMRRSGSQPLVQRKPVDAGRLVAALAGL
ncbi:response regulator, partial [Methylobacterium trifolii]|uniref:response regulator n=1 Tax=Methylobacterium trifolii TaxID=1003092 RepID=UPI001EDFA866